MEPETLPAKPKRTRLLLLIFALVLVVASVLALVLVWAKTKQPSSQTPVVTLKTPSIKPQLLTTGLELPTSIVSTADSTDKRLFVLEQPGKIRIVNAEGQLQPTPFLDIQAKVLPGGEMGLLGLAFHPSYKENGYFYVNYVDKNQHTVIARYEVRAESGAADPGSEKVLLRLEQPYQNHNGGDLVFGPDGYLYISLGDGGSAGDPENRAQNKGSYFGKILRVDVDSGDPYAVPDTNPFANEGGAKPEIWAYGLRNPWRISFDKTNGDLYIADVGQGKLEEVNVQKAGSKGGENYGWRCFEGSQAFKPAGCKDASRYTAPVLEYNHNQGRCSITGGYVYRGSRYPALAGKYFYGDYCNGQLFYGNNQNGKWTNALALETSYKISTFGQGSDGELYFADFEAGSIYHIQDVANKR